MNESSKEKTKQTTMGNYFTRQSKDKEKDKKEKMEEDKPTNFIDRKTRFKNSSTTDEWSSGWSTGWSSGDWKKKDTEDYRNGYPGKSDRLDQTDNLKFYQNELKSYPDGDKIDTIHKKWWGNYKLLERHHGYIQWLFPIRESGMNFHAQVLQKHEADGIINDEKAHQRVLKSYKMMLDFYGMKIKDEVTGEIERAENWKERFSHLNRSYHNYLRITRILKCLGELGYEHMKVRFLEFVIEEALEKKTLKNCYESCKDYWVETLRADDERKRLQDYMRKVEDGYESGDDKYGHCSNKADDSNMSNLVSTHNDVDMDDDSQEMKHYAKEAEEGSEKVPLESQMSLDNIVDQEKSNVDKKCDEGSEIHDSDAMDTEQGQKQETNSGEEQNKETGQNPEKNSETETNKDLSTSQAKSNAQTDSQDTQSYNLQNV